MLDYYTIAEGIPEYINMLEDAQRKLERANLPMSNDQLVAIASTSVLAANDFPRTTEEWEALPPASKTWAAWKTRYRTAHTARKRQLLAAGAGHAGDRVGAANAAIGGEDDPIPPDTFTRLDGYLDNLAAAATTERTTLTQLIENNATLTASVTSLTASVAALSAAYTLLVGKQGPAAVPAVPRPASTAPRNRLDPTGYCWTHGYRVTKGHTSATCKTPMEGHKTAATRNNTMGGSTANKNNAT